MPTAALAIPKKRIAIIDDELGGIKAKQLTPDVSNFLSDSTSETFDLIWGKGIELLGLSAKDQLNVQEIETAVFTDEFVQKVLLSPSLKALNNSDVNKVLQMLWEKDAQLEAIRKVIRLAFLAEQFDIEFMGTRPNGKEVVNYDLVILDLVMEGYDHVNAVVDFLTQLSKAATEITVLPPIMLFSSNWEELNKHRMRFRTEAQISAAGLSILPKLRLTDPNFGSSGLSLLWQQMSFQQETAHAIRVLTARWDSAFEEARKETAGTLWNLDASALQRIHLTAFNDNDPFEEHLHELIARSNIWHVEKQPGVIKAIGNLSGQLTKYIDAANDPAKLSYRIASHSIDDLDSMRQLMTSFCWSPLEALSDLLKLDPSEVPARLNRSIPFGTVLRVDDSLKNFESAEIAEETLRQFHGKFNAHARRIRNVPKAAQAKSYQKGRYTVSFHSKPLTGTGVIRRKLKFANPSEHISNFTHAHFHKRIENTSEMSEVLIHITQQCDLGKREIFDKETSLIFLRAEPRLHIKGAASKKDIEGETWLPGFVYKGKDYDLLVDPNKLIALPVNVFIQYAKNLKWVGIGRLRADVANQLSQRAANSVTRPADFKFSHNRKTVFKAKVCLFIPKINGGQDESKWFGKTAHETETIIEISEIAKEGMYVSDDLSSRIAIWVEKLCKENANSPKCSTVEMICKALRLGITGKAVAQHLEFKVLEADNFEEAWKTTSGATPSLKQTTLLIVKEKKSS